jgi:hypothetical protein
MKKARRKNLRCAWAVACHFLCQTVAKGSFPSASQGLSPAVRGTSVLPRIVHRRNIFPSELVATTFFKAAETLHEADWYQSVASCICRAALRATRVMPSPDPVE